MLVAWAARTAAFRGGHDNIDLETDQLRGKLSEPIQLPSAYRYSMTMLLSLYIPMLTKTFTEYIHVARKRAAVGATRTPIRATPSLLRLDSKRRKNEAQSEHDREPDHRMGTSVEGWLSGSLAERPDAHQRPGLDEHRGAGRHGY